MSPYLRIQLPPRLAFSADRAAAFLAALRDRFGGLAVCEPRHASWFESGAEEILRSFQVARAAVDPAPVPAAAANALTLNEICSSADPSK